MDKKIVLAQAAKHGDFYLYYRKFRAQGTTYLVGTIDFDNKYIQAKYKSGAAGLSGTGDLAGLQKAANGEGKLITFSWTNDKFRVIEMKDIRRMTPLASEIRNARNYKRS